MDLPVSLSDRLLTKGGFRNAVALLLSYLQNIPVDQDLGIAAGTDTYTVAPSPAYSVLKQNKIYAIRTAATNTTTAPTLTVNSLAPFTFKKNGLPLQPGDMPAIVYFTYDGSFLQLLNPAKGFTRGKVTMWLPADAWAARQTNGSVPNVSESTTNKVIKSTQDFADTFNRGCQTTVAMPKGWDAGSFTAKFHWTYAAGAGNVVWQIRGMSLADGDAIDTAFGTAQVIIDAPISANVEHISGDTPTVTLGNGPNPRERVVFEVFRDSAHASDTFTGTAQLLGVELTFVLTGADDS